MWRRKTFAAEQRGFDFADDLNVVIDRRLKRDDTAGIDAEHFAGAEIPFENGAARVNERESVALESFRDESFAAEKSGAESLV